MTIHDGENMATTKNIAHTPKRDRGYDVHRTARGMPREWVTLIFAGRTGRQVVARGFGPTAMQSMRAALARALALARAEGRS